MNIPTDRARYSAQRILPALFRKKSVVFLAVILLWGVSATEVSAAPVMVLNNSGHAYDTIGSTINALLGRSYTASEFVIHHTAYATGSCANDATYAGSTPAIALATSTGFLNTTFPIRVERFPLCSNCLSGTPLRCFDIK